MAWLCYLLVFSFSCFLAWLLRHYALATNLLDIPNHRSSHVVPTPRGGGVSFVLCFLVSVLCLSYLGLISNPLMLALLGAGSLVAILGFLDDLSSLPARWRLLGHFIASGFALYVLGGMPELPILAWHLPAGWFANTLALFYLVWLLNLYNFMDGIDGIAAVEAVTVCLGGAFLYFLHGDMNATLLTIILAFSVAGFLFWNFPPAKIFMGDAGSGFLGLILGILSIQASQTEANLYWSWLILLGVFIVDSTVTLIRRGLRKQGLFEAHRSHAYQYASRHYGKHLPVTMGVLLINLLWLLPWAFAVGLGKVNGCLGLMFAYLPVVVLAFKFNAGKPE